MGVASGCGEQEVGVASGIYNAKQRGFYSH